METKLLQQQQDEFTSKTIFFFFVLSCLLDFIPIYRAVFLGEAERLVFLLFSALLLISYKLHQRNKFKLLSQSIFAASLFLCFIAMFFSNGMFNSLTSFWGVTFSLLCFATVNKHISIIFSIFTLTTFLLSRIALELGFLHELSINNTNITIETLHVLVMSFFIYQAATRLSQLVKFPIKAMEASLEREHELNKAKDTFLSNMSHELRTPLNGIYGVLQIIDLKTPANSKDKKLVSSAKWATESLTQIVNDILDMQKLIGNKIQLYPQWVICREVFLQAVHLYQPITNTKNVALNFVISENVPAHIYCDELRLGQILNNVLGNAIKFTEQGSIDLIVDYENNKLVIIISDTGIGMDETALSHLYDRFTQADSSTTKKYGGTGLGMAITKQLVELMNGTIGVESRVGKGSTFTIKIPLEGQGIHSEPSNQSLIIGI